MVDRPKIDVRKQKVVIDQIEPGEWWVMLDDGSVSVYLTPEAALKSVQKAANKGNKDATVTTIEWRNTPEGFVPPKGQL